MPAFLQEAVFVQRHYGAGLEVCAEPDVEILRAVSASDDDVTISPCHIQIASDLDVAVKKASGFGLSPNTEAASSIDGRDPRVRGRRARALDSVLCNACSLNMQSASDLDFTVKKASGFGLSPNTEAASSIDGRHPSVRGCRARALDSVLCNACSLNMQTASDLDVAVNRHTAQARASDNVDRNSSHREFFRDIGGFTRDQTGCSDSITHIQKAINQHIPVKLTCEFTTQSVNANTRFRFPRDAGTSARKPGNARSVRGHTLYASTSVPKHAKTGNIASGSKHANAGLARAEDTWLMISNYDRRCVLALYSVSNSVIHSVKMWHIFLLIAVYSFLS